MNIDYDILCFICGFFDDDIGCFCPDHEFQCPKHRYYHTKEVEEFEKKLKYPTFLDCYNCTDICTDCPITRKE